MKHTDWAELLHVDKPECWLCYFCMLDSTVTVVVIMLGITATLTKHVHLAWLSNFLKHLLQFEVEVEVWVDSFILQQHAKLCIEETFFSPCYAGVAWSESLNNLNDSAYLSGLGPGQPSCALWFSFRIWKELSQSPASAEWVPCHCYSHVRITLCATVYLLFRATLHDTKG